MKEADRTQHLLTEIQSAQTVIARNQYTGSARDAYLVGVLRATLAGMAGLSDSATHASCFETSVTEAIQELVDTINQE
jgi:hypothetical protein